MFKVNRAAFSLVLGAVLLCGNAWAPQAAKAEVHTYTDKAHLNDTPVTKVVKHQEYWIVTNELKTTVTVAGKEKEIEAYRWDPGFLVVDKNKPVTLHFYGVKGKEHPFVIEGLNVGGNVKKGEVTTVTFTPTKAGTYPVICLTHPTIDKNGPMIGYLRVQ